MPVTYPSQESAVAMNSNGPLDSRFVVPGGKLLYHRNRDARLPYLYELRSHPLAQGRKNIKQIFVYVQDSTPAALERAHALECSMHVPLGSDALMTALGLFQLKPGSIVYARPLGEATGDHDIVVAWIADGTIIFKDEPAVIENLKQARDDILGKSEECDLGNKGTYFERLGQKGVKDTRCYSLTVSHQHSRSLVGPTAGGKVYGNSLSENERLRQQVVQINTHVAMRVLKEFAPNNFLQALEDNAEVNNLPRVGDPDNYAFPAIQLNLAPAVAFASCETEGLDKAMGDFGATAGHVDKLDSAGGLTAMISNSRLPSGYENGRFHILLLGCYVRLKPFIVTIFSGLMRHGGTPPIAPRHRSVAPHAYRVMVVCYPPHSIMSASGVHVIPFASLPRGELFKLGPEVTSHRSHKGISLSPEANWAQDGGAIMTPITHANFMGRGMLQFCDYICNQVGGLEIDGKKFLASMSIRGNNGERIPLSEWSGAPDQGDSRQNQLLRWIAHSETRSKIIPMHHDIDYERLRDELEEGALGFKRIYTRAIGDSQKKHKKRKTNEPVSHSKRRKIQDTISTAPSESAFEQHMTSGDANSSQASFECSCDVVGEHIHSHNHHNVPSSPVFQPSRELIPSGILRRSLRLQNLCNNECDTDPEEDTATTLGDSDSEHPRQALLLKNSQHQRSVIRISDLLNPIDVDTSNTQPHPGIASVGDQSMQHTRSMNRRDHSISEYLAKINIDAIRRSISDLEQANAARNEGFTGDSIQKKQLAEICIGVVKAIDSDPTSVLTAATIPSFWQSVDQMHKHASFSSAEMRTLRAQVMTLALRIHRWIVTVLGLSLDRSVPRCWAHKLVDNIQTALFQHTRSKQLLTLKSNDYIPGLPGSIAYTTTLPRFTMDLEKNRACTIEIASSAIRNWLAFPNDVNAVVQASLLDSFMQATGNIGVFYLDEVWRLFMKPIHHLMNGCDSSSKRSKRRVHSVLVLFDDAIKAHPICQLDSLEHTALLDLGSLAHRWESNSPLPQPTTSTISLWEANNLPDGALPILTKVPNQDARGITRLQKMDEEKMQIFVDFLRQLIPLTQTNDMSTFSESSNAIQCMVSKDLDFYLPFRQKAPSMSLAATVIYHDTAALRMDVGLFNILAFRSTFYSSPWAKSNLKWFTSYNDWIVYSNSFGFQSKALKEAYFTNAKAYGQPTNHLDLDNLSIYWARRGEWIQHLKNNPKHDILKLYNFFLTFPNVGALTAMLIIGDLIECTFIPMPNVEEWATLVVKVNKGACLQLQSLGLVSDKAGPSYRAHCKAAFIKLHQYVFNNLTHEECGLINYNVVMLEHGLCKRGRILKRVKK